MNLENLHPAVIAVLAGLPSFALGYLAYRQSRKVHKVSESAGVITGMNQLNVNLQADNKALRDIIKEFVIEVRELREEIKTLNKLLVKNGREMVE